MSFVPIDELRSAEPVERSSRPNRLPPWFKVTIQQGPRYRQIRDIMDSLELHTICEEARCPNVWECWNNGTATFLILGDICTRRCHYCAVTTGRPHPLNPDEPVRVAEAVKALGLRHAVITSVNRDELEDGGATIFAQTIREIRRLIPSCAVEVLIPDFEGSVSALATVVAEEPDLLNHNIETVRRLFPALRPQGKYQRSIELLDRAKRLGAKTKAGLIVGMGETEVEIREVMQDLRAVGCDILTIGQYLQPTKRHLPVVRFYHPDEFAAFKADGLALGYEHVESGPLVRSSYHAEQQTSRSTC
ncbi:MAG: lipoyl synthase [Nitrospiraceae bacterium]